jgi:hypothetical protein
MLITGQRDKMLTDRRNSKGSTELSATAMWIVVSGDNHNVLNTVFSLYFRVLRQGMRYSKVIVSLLTLLKLLAAATIT